MVVSRNRQKLGVRKGTWVCLCILIHVSWLLLLVILILLTSCMAKDFGTHGIIFPIEEEDPIALIQQKLKSMEESGELKKHQESLQRKTRETVQRPQPVEGITKATKSHVFYYDPSYVVEKDLVDHTGKVFAKVGTKINPLKTVSLSHTFLFFDGDDEEQKVWAQGRTQKSEGSAQNAQKVRLILTKGAPLTLSEELGVPVYFDQGGVLTKKLGIVHVPAMVTQGGLKLRIEEISSSLLTEIQSPKNQSEEIHPHKKTSRINKKGAVLEDTVLPKMGVESRSKALCLDVPCLSQDREAGS